ncbi:MAG TPA: hypothetical protein VLV90_01275, partial [Burkholderiales bacterium]|nr:hypothetical protein [Burkholderiales bacterium]
MPSVRTLAHPCAIAHRDGLEYSLVTACGTPSNTGEGGNTMRSLRAIAAIALLGGCGLSNPILKSEIVSFDDVIENATDKLLVLNILRARDQAPLHFMALPSLRQSIQENNSISLVELLGPRAGSTQRRSATLGASLQFSPTFDLNHVYSKEFVTGMTSPIDPKYVKYWLDRGLDYRLVMLLFFSAAEITMKDAKPAADQEKFVGGKAILVKNDPKGSIEEIRNRTKLGEASHCGGRSQFERYLSLVDRFTGFTARTISKPKLLGCVVYDEKHPAKFFQALAAAQQAKVKYKYDKANKTYELSSESEESQTQFCLGGNGPVIAKSGALGPRESEDAATCKEPSEKETKEAKEK